MSPLLLLATQQPNLPMLVRCKKSVSRNRKASPKVLQTSCRTPALVLYPQVGADNALRLQGRRSGADTGKELVGNRFIARNTAPGESDPGEAPRVPIGCE